ncbi:MAG: hypothetical protein QOG53_2510 [Frankiales bacterium]|jgi:hypothetical protein|nr:hypothetical protein [Frankiales bacterium]
MNGVADPDFRMALNRFLTVIARWLGGFACLLILPTAALAGWLAADAGVDVVTGHRAACAPGKSYEVVYVDWRTLGRDWWPPSIDCEITYRPEYGAEPPVTRRYHEAMWKAYVSPLIFFVSVFLFWLIGRWVISPLPPLGKPPAEVARRDEPPWSIAR